MGASDNVNYAQSRTLRGGGGGVKNGCGMFSLGGGGGG